MGAVHIGIAFATCRLRVRALTRVMPRRRDATQARPGGVHEPVARRAHSAIAVGGASASDSRRAAGDTYPHASHGPPTQDEWNVSRLARLSSGLLQHLVTPIPGVTDPMLYIGMRYSTFCWHVEDNWLYSLRLHGSTRGCCVAVAERSMGAAQFQSQRGAQDMVLRPRVSAASLPTRGDCSATSGACRHAAESLESTILEKLFPKLARNFPSLLHSKCFMCSPVLLKVS
jgi:hypothetical protein